jgi:hypothetical protein
VANVPYNLTELYHSTPGLRRVAHGYATSGTWSRLLYRGVTVGRELVSALPRDALRKFRRRGPSITRAEIGADRRPSPKSVALYVHYAPDGTVSEMVLCQLRLLRASGFAIVFATGAAHVPDAGWDAVKDIAALVVQRQNFGLDFGAWSDLVPEVRRRWPSLDELLLANDSVLGPLFPLDAIVDAMRSGGAGLFGLTESLQGGPHLQSYLLLARGHAAAHDLLGFLDRLYITHSKWLLIQMSEIRLARWMRTRGHRVAALFGYERVIEAALAQPEERVRLAASHARLQGLAELSPTEAQAVLMNWPLNPTHHLWHTLVTQMHSPFIKTELVRRNPGRLPGVSEWPAAVPADAPCSLPILRAHLQAMGPG